MAKLPPIKARKLIKFLKKKNFFEVRQKGSHKFFSHRDGRTTVVPYHPEAEIGPGLLRKILTDIEISPEEFLRND
jgi:predicted RNA binding protein YcfA (HicA-like mRNA interferase family)